MKRDKLVELVKNAGFTSADVDDYLRKKEKKKYKKKQNNKKAKKKKRPIIFYGMNTNAM